MNILDDAPGILLLVVLGIVALLCWAAIHGMNDAVNADKIAVAIICMVIAVILLVVALLGAFYLIGRVLD